MIMNTLIKNASLVNEGRVLVCDVLIQGEIIKEISKQIEDFPPNTNIIDASGKFLIPGIIDDQVHFREELPLL